MIRVLHVVTHMNRGGLETMIMNYYRNIDREKVQFDFLVHRGYRADYDEEIERLGGKIYRISKLNPFSTRYKKELNDFFKQHPEYQIVHVHQDCMSSVILRAAKKNGVKVRIAHSHNMSQDKNLKYPIKMYYRKYITKYATELMACGNQAGNWMFSGAKFYILSNAIDAKQYIFNIQKRVEVRNANKIDDDEIVIGHVGRFSLQKNHEFLINIFEKIEKKSKAKLLLVGDGELRREIENKVKNMKLEDKVILTGVRSDVSDLMQAMDVFVFPSLYEGLPVTMVEAQAAGLPCVISDKVPPECILTDGLVDILPLSAEPETWAAKILEKKNLPRTDRRNEIAAHGFDITTEAVKLQEFYINAYEQNC